MRVHVFQHVAFEGLGYIAQWLAQRQASVSYTHFYQSNTDVAGLSECHQPYIELPQLASFDLLIVLGGPMSVNQEQDYPWLVQEKQFIAQAIAANKAILGICLGAQLIAASLQAKVYANLLKEVGWFEIEAIKDLSGSGIAQPLPIRQSIIPPIFAFPARINVLHWHGETFDLPIGAIHLAKSQACLHQAFQYQTHVIGLQFHLEATPETLQAMVTHCADDLVNDLANDLIDDLADDLAENMTTKQPFIQDATAILSMTAQHQLAVNKLMDRILSFLLRDA